MVVKVLLPIQWYYSYLATGQRLIYASSIGEKLPHLLEVRKSCKLRLCINIQYGWKIETILSFHFKIHALNTDLMDLGSSEVVFLFTQLLWALGNFLRINWERHTLLSSFVLGALFQAPSDPKKNTGKHHFTNHFYNDN